MVYGIEVEVVGVVMVSGKQGDKGGCIRNLFSKGSNFGKELVVFRSKLLCVYCGGNYGVWSCRRFQNLGANERWNIVKDKRFCIRCLVL